MKRLGTLPLMFSCTLSPMMHVPENYEVLFLQGLTPWVRVRQGSAA